MAFGPDEAKPFIESFEKIARSRRSVRVFDGTPIPEKVVNACIDLALVAPNSSNLQQWEFFWVRNSEKKEALVRACLSQPAAKTAAELIVCVARTKTWKRANKQMLDYLAKLEASGTRVPKSAWSYYRSLTKIMYNNGPLGLFGLLKRVLFWFQGLRKPTPREPTSETEMRMWAVKSTALASENLMLAFRAYGFDTCPMEGYDKTLVRKILKLPRDAVIVMVVGAGKRSERGIYGPQVRFERSQFVHEV